MEENILKKYFHYSRDERISLITFSAVCVFVILIPKSFPFFFNPTANTDFNEFKAEIQQFHTQQEQEGTLAWQNRNTTTSIYSKDEKTAHELFYFDPNTASVTHFTRLGLSEKQANTILNYRNKGGKFRVPKDFSKIYGIKNDYTRLAPYISISNQKSKSKKAKQYTEKSPAELFPFDPNTATKADFERLGLSGRTAQSILNYRNAGAQFHKKEDLQKVYTLSPADYQRLASYIEISTEKLAEKKATLPPSKNNKKTAYTTPNNVISSKIDINKAGLEEWKQLPGIGSGYANRIINYRNKLGGFVSVEQISTTYNLPDSVFQKIQSYLIASPIAQKIKINQVTVEELKNHPYINWKEASRIIAYRDQHGAFTDLTAFQKLHAFKAGFFEKIAPYLDFE